MNLVVPLIYFWWGASRIDVPPRGSVWGRFALSIQTDGKRSVMRVALARVPLRPRHTLGIKGFYINRGDSQGQASPSAQSDIFWRVGARRSAIWGLEGGASRWILCVLHRVMCFLTKCQWAGRNPRYDELKGDGGFYYIGDDGLGTSGMTGWTTDIPDWLFSDFTHTTENCFPSHLFCGTSVWDGCPLRTKMVPLASTGVLMTAVLDSHRSAPIHLCVITIFPVTISWN